MSKKPIRRGGFSLVGPIAQKAGAVGAVATPPAPAGASSYLHDEIAMRAREIWEIKGCPADRDLEIWLSAEREMTTGRR
jgi:hypothetical protein